MFHTRLVRTTALIKPGIVVLGILFSGLIGWTLWQGWVNARERAVTTSNSLAVNLERELGRMFETLDLSLRSAVHGKEMPGIAELSPNLRRALLFDGAASSKGFGVLVLVNETGDIIDGSMGPGGSGINVTDRDYFKAHRDQAGLDTIVSRPLQSRQDGQWSVTLSRRINHPDGRFAGVAVGALKLDYLESLLDQSVHERNIKASLISTNGWLLTRTPLNEGAYGRDVSNAPLYRYFAASSVGSFQGRSQLDNVDRLHSYRQIGTLPLIIDVGISTRELWAEWWSRASIDLILLGSLALALTGLGWLLRRELHIRIQAEEQTRTASRAVAASMARLDALFQNASDSMVVVAVHLDGSFSYESVNPALQASLGLDSAALVGKSPAECLPTAVAQSILDQWRECVKARRPLQYSITIVMPDRTFDSEIFMAPVFDETGRVCRLVGGGRDVTDRNRLEAQLRQAQKMETVGQLTAGIAHDFNNLLQAILGAVDLLEQQINDQEKCQQSIAIARRAAYRGASLTHRLLTVSRQQSLSPALLDLRDTLSEMIELFVPVLGPHIQVEQDVKPGLWPVMADVQEVETCLMNLAVNARDAMTAGGVLRIGLRNGKSGEDGAPDLPKGEYVVISVQDTGVGMAASTLARACDPFFTTKAPGKGSGLGLSMVSGFAAQSGGAMQLDSRAGYGTRVELWLPRASGVPATAKAEADAHVSGGSGRILLVDDDAEVREILRMILADAGFTVIQAENGDKALDLIDKGALLDLIVSDYAMPLMNGAELITRVLEIKPGLPALIITGFDAIGPNGRLPPGVSILRKPLRRRELLIQVKAALAERAAPPSAPEAEFASAERFTDNVVQFSGKQFPSEASN